MNTSTTAEAELQLLVDEIVEPATGVRRLRLLPVDGAALPAWAPGAHIDLHLGASGGASAEEGAIVRQYSLCGDPADTGCWHVAVLREAEGRGGSAYVHDKLAPGDIVTARGPRNHFALAQATSYRFIAGGIGITPILPMVAAAQAAGADWTLDYGGRTRASMAFADGLVASHGDRVRLHPADEVGLMPLEEILAEPTPGTLVYCCGPAPLLAAVEERCASWPEGALHLERFTAVEPDPDAVDGSFEVEFDSTGEVITVAPDQTTLEAVRAAGFDVLSSCEEGTCGTCETGVLAGEVDHRDSILTASERAANDVMYLCVSRAAGTCPRLVLDL